LYYFWKTPLSEEQKAERKDLYGGWRDALQTAKPYLWSLRSGKTCLELPITTIPLLKVPFHLSYLLYLSRFSEGLMFGYLSLALYLCRITRTTPNFLLHPLDFLSADQVPEVAFFPGMDIEKEKKREIFERVISRLRRNFRLVPMSTLALELQKSERFKYIMVRHE
jgi:hypothetical protein